MYNEEEVSRTPQDMDIPELQDLIHESYQKYLGEKKQTSERRKLKKEYLDLINYYNGRVGFTAYSSTL